jgi:hypothetical protein
MKPLECRIELKGQRRSSPGPVRGSDTGIAEALGLHGAAVVVKFFPKQGGGGSCWSGP